MFVGGENVPLNISGALRRFLRSYGQELQSQDRKFKKLWSREGVEETRSKNEKLRVTATVEEGHQRVREALSLFQTSKDETKQDEALGPEPDDPWQLLHEGECRHKEFAYFTKCVTDEQRVLDQCFASMCSLLATTDPPCVVVFVSRWVLKVARNIFARNGIVPVVAPEWRPLPDDHPYTHLTGSTGNSSFDRLYTFSKFEVARLTQYGRLAAFDADILFMRNATGLESYQNFAASQVPKGKYPDIYMNNGMMVLRPSPRIYNGLVDLWRSGKFTLYYSDEEATEQDVFTELCWVQQRCGPVSDLDACVFNHGSWIPGKFYRDCPASKAVLRHNFKASREPILATNLVRSLQVGTCRQRAAGIPTSEACFPPGTMDEYGEVLDYNFCCYGRNTFFNYVGGNPVCWYKGFTFERCCLGSNDAEMLRKELVDYGDSWYGLSSLPDHPSANWANSICERHYIKHRFTLASLSPKSLGRLGFHEHHLYPLEDPPSYLHFYGLKCRNIDGHLLLFYFAFDKYFARHKDHPIARGLHKRMLVSLEGLAKESGENVNMELSGIGDVVCVPTTCTVRPPPNVQSAAIATRVLLWHFMLTQRMDLTLEIVQKLPAPDTQDFYGIRTLSAGTWGFERNDWL
eukprot:TRINITY_DN57569_c0_g1_i1.p1 TRINITY_DN57569_c0_g1~~TRINITY_DN57569_c0_g1_i1.p1  ORF type:complete len:669 (+),score=63.83 TRINITY_DN57569_c0_g1_i1:117-2009(+)